MTNGQQQVLLPDSEQSQQTQSGGCIGGFLRHRWRDDKCERCGVEKSSQPRRVRSQEELNDLRQRRISSQPQLSAEDQAKIKQQRESIARTIARIPHTVQSTVAQTLYNYDGEAFTLTEKEYNELVICWLSVLEAYNWQTDSPLFALFVLVATEARISLRQWARMAEDQANTDKKK